MYKHEQIHEMVKEFAKGTPVSTICEKYNISRPYFNALKQRYIKGLVNDPNFKFEGDTHKLMRRRSGQRKQYNPLTQSEKEALIEDYKNLKIPIKKLLCRHKISQTYLYNILQENNVPARFPKLAKPRDKVIPKPKAVHPLTKTTYAGVFQNMLSEYKANVPVEEIVRRHKLADSNVEMLRILLAYFDKEDTVISDMENELKSLIADIRNKMAPRRPWYARFFNKKNVN